MTFSRDIDAFIRDYVKDLNEGTASIFAGAGLSLPAGFVNWSELMQEIAHELGIVIKPETDLVSLAQYHFNENRTKSKINRTIIEEFTKQATETLNHKIIARLPISSVWTTNYDNLIEKAFLGANKVADVKYKNEQLLTNIPKRDVVIYKMHGDANHASEAILIKEQYEQYHQSHEPFINTLSGELTTKTFLFLGFSFTDPNLDYVLSRLNFRFSEHKRQHYSIVKRHSLGDHLNPDQPSLDYNNRKQALMINDLKRYGIKCLMVDSYDEITFILQEIDRRFKKRTVFISGSAELFDPYERAEAIRFIHSLSKKIIESDFRIVNGFGWGIGSSVINGALEAIYESPLRYSEDQLILRPFPQYESGGNSLPTLWEEYRNKMISLSGISIFIFGNKIEDGKIVDANGVMREFKISNTLRNVCIPIGCTGYIASQISDIVLGSPDDYYHNSHEIVPLIKQLAEKSTPLISKVDVVIKILNSINKY